MIKFYANKFWKLVYKKTILRWIFQNPRKFDEKYYFEDN